MRSKRIRCVLLVAWLSLAAGAAGPAAAVPGDVAGGQPSWWQGAVAWLAERLPFVGWVAAASEDGETAPPEDDGSTPTVDLLDPSGDQDGTGIDTDGDGVPDMDPDG